ncbi:MAG: hypothetical protein AAF296_09075 [Pseudomonadota bacterium]
MFRRSIFASLVLAFACFANAPAGADTYCDIDTTIINLKAQGFGKGDCIGDDDVYQCIWNSIEEQVDGRAIDIYVPGTGAEDGNPKQFCALAQKADEEDRAAFSIKYQAGGDHNAIAYQDGVKDSRDALKLLLKAIHDNTDDPDVRVFGHSKGAHSVAVVSALSADHYSYAKFFAFGQPGRTDDEIPEFGGDGLDDAARQNLRGTPGSIEKLSDNLVGFTWENDEVQFYEGGLAGMPESVQIPGPVNPRKGNNRPKIGGAITLNFRWDHHNTYGGDYTEETFPYCAAGSRNSWRSDDDCGKTEVSFKPNFWGNDSCYDAVMMMMDTDDNVGERRYVGHSKPRDNCFSDNAPRSDRILIKDVQADYHFNIRDKDCKVNLRFEFLPKGGSVRWGHNDGPSLSITKLQDMSGVARKVRSEDFYVPNDFRLKVRTEMIEKPGIGNCFAPAATQLKIKSLKVVFTHPDTGEEVERYLINNGSKSGWKRRNSGRKHDDMDIFKDGDMLKFSSASRAGKHGMFYKDFTLTNRVTGDIEVESAIVTYKFNIPDQHCKVNTTFEFLPGGATITDAPGEGPKLSVTKLVGMDEYATKTKEDFWVSNHMRLVVRASVTEKDSGTCWSALPVQLHINNLEMTFKHPHEDIDTDEQNIIRGAFEGDMILGKITGHENVAWRKYDPTGDDDMDMFNTKDSIKISSMARDGKSGIFYKDIYLVD